MTDRYRPSNGSEAEKLKEDYCYRCACWDNNVGCDIESQAWLYNMVNDGYPEEWISEDGEVKCSAFKKA